MDQNNFDDETPAVGSTKRPIVWNKQGAKETMKSNKEVMLKKAINMLEEYKPLPSK